MIASVVMPGLIRGFVLACLLGLVVRVAALPSWGTFDVEVQKAWSSRAVTGGVADIYGPSDDELLRMAASGPGPKLLRLAALPIPRTVFVWGTARYFVDYPPGSILVLWAEGKLYEFVAPTMDNRAVFNGFINLGPLLGSAAILILLRRSAPGRLGETRGLAFWLNPAVILAAPVLGYQDTIFGVLALGAVLALAASRYAFAAALLVASGLLKPQGALLIPTFLAVVLTQARWRVWLQCAAAGAATALMILSPWWTEGYLLSALDGCRRPLTQTTLAPYGFNLWWIAGYVMDWARTGPWPLARVVSIEDFGAWAGWDPRLPARVLLGAATLGNIVLLVRGLRADRRLLPLSVVVQVLAYAALGTSVHENHTFLVVIVAPLLLGALAQAAALQTASSALLFASLFFTAGLGRHVTRLRSIEWLRGLVGLDLTVVVAVLQLALLAFAFAWMARPRPTLPPPEAA